MDSILDAAKEQLSAIPPALVKPICVGAVIIAVFLAIVFFLLCVLYVNTRPTVPIIKKNEKKDPQNALKKEDITPKNIKMKYEDLPIISGRLGEFLALNGILNVGPITKIFFQVLDVIRNTTYDIRWRYKTPCLMMVGPENSGKSTISNALKFEKLSSDDSLTPMWKLFKNGAIFEMPKPDAAEKSANFWSFISELFVFIRPRRPLDGIIVTLPADMLLSPMTDITSSAKELFERIFAFQHEVNFRLPIYIIVTKSDLIPGFTDFSHILDHQSKQQIFGWSNPNALNTVFSTSCITDLFHTVNNGIKRAILLFSKKDEVSEELRNAVLFETYFNQLKDPLSLYLNTMFQSHNPADGLLLRGVYFTGRPKEIAVSEELLQPSALSPQPYTSISLKRDSSYNDDLYFIQDLFSEKIFKEHNIAYPIKDDAIDMAKTIFRNKVIFAGASVFITVGWYYGNIHIRDKINNYYRTFASIKNMMVKLQHMETQLGGVQDQIELNKQIKTLLQSMPVISRFDFLSPFVPQSWFSSLYKNMSETTGLVFDAVVIRAMFIDLNMNTRSVLEDTDTSDTDIKRYGRQDIFDVSSFTSFRKLREFTGKIATLKRLTREYNSIRTLEDRKSMLDLTTALFKDKFDIVEEMKSRSPNKKLLPPQFDLKVFKEAMEDRLIENFNNFVTEMFNGTIERILENICGDIDRLANASKQANVAYTTEDLAKVYQKTILFAEILKNKNFEWRSDDHFMPSKEYAAMVESLNASEIVSMDCVRDLLQSAEVAFQKFKNKIREQETSMTGKILTEDLTALSPTFELFQKELKTILDLPFICMPPKASLTTVIMDDKMLIWDVKRLSDLAGLIEKYYAFAEAMPPEIRPDFFDNYKTLVRKCFYPTAQAMLGNAQIFEDIPLGKARTLLEDSYKRQADNIRKCSLFLGKIAKFLSEVSAGDNLRDSGFSAMLISHYFGLLEKIDALFNLETPYSTGGTLFDTWNGEQNPAFLNIKEDQALKKYLLSQFSRLKFLAKDLASPVVEILSMPVFAEDIRDHTLIEKWQEIIANVDDYEAQKPGNSVAALESFLSETLKKVTISSFDPQGEIKSMSENGGDFFTSKRSDIAKALIQRADLIQYDKAATAYRSIQSFFNGTLAHKFPFGDSDDDATLTDIEKFVEIYEQNSANLEEILKANAEAKHVNPEVFDFLGDMSKVVPFLKNWIAHTKTSDPSSPIMSFLVQLRPSPDAEAATSSVMERVLSVKGVAVADGGNAVFFNGDPVTLAFSWVQGSSEKPYAGNDMPKNLEIDQNEATFSFNGRWALIRLIEEHKTNKEVAYPNGVLLQFEVPELDRDNGNNVVTSRMVLKITPQVKVGDKPTPMEWPVFPSICPNLHAGASTEGESE